MRAVLSIVVLAILGCAEPRPSAADLETRKQRLAAEHLTALDVDFARLTQEGSFKPYTPWNFTYEAPDEASAQALVAKLRREAGYSAEPVPPAEPAGWSVAGQTTILPNEREYHAKLLPIMVEMGLQHGCELTSWTMDLAGAPPGRQRPAAD